MKKYILHLENAAVNWENASPVGCGKAGMMVFGHAAKEKIVLNEETIWSGEPADLKEQQLPEKIAHVRKLLLEGHVAEANAWVHDHFGEYRRVKPYEYAGNLWVTLHDTDDCTEYRRDLDLTDGVCTVQYEKDGTWWKRAYFASYPANLLCAQYTAGKPFAAQITYDRECMDALTADANGLTATCHTAYGNHTFVLRVRVETDGRTEAADGTVSVQDASFIRLYTVIATSYRYGEAAAEEAEKQLTQADRGWDVLLEESKKDHRSLMNRSDISFEGGDPALEERTVSDRLERLKNDPDAEDPGLVALYWQFGKYLLIGSSRPGSLPANLQGVWADGMTPPWGSDYHTNINLQMNYWQAEEANLSDCTLPLFAYMNTNLLPGGKRAARDIYGTRGMVVHHLSDIYQFAGIADGSWGIWPVGGAWMAYHLWEHYLYTGDVDFLRDTAYPYIHEAVLFWMDNLIEDANGTLHTGPSASPENAFYIEENGERKTANLTLSPTMDVEIVGGLLDFYVECEKILQIDPETAAQAAEKRKKMVPLQIGKHGQLMEWMEDYDEPEPGHRHISHAFALYPAAQITRNTPELYRAIEVTMERRLASGGGHTGWSRAWLINLFARLRRGEKTYENIRALFTRSTLPNLLDTHAPFQIDGNFGGAAGIGEMLLQSHEGMVSLLPALSSHLANGSFTGLRARGGYTVSASWENGQVTEFEITAAHPGPVTVELPDGERIELDVNDTVFWNR